MIKTEMGTNRLIRTSIYPHIMTKQKITISIDSDIAMKLRDASIKKYGNARSMSRLVEDLAQGEVMTASNDVSCQLIQTKWGLTQQKKFDEVVETVVKQVDALDMRFADGDYLSDPEKYFVLKEAMERRLNRIAKGVNDCPSCSRLDEPLPVYPDEGHNFAKLQYISTMHK